MHDQLLRAYPGQLVALYRSHVVDHHEAPALLEKRVRQRLGASPVLIAPVEPVPATQFSSLSLIQRFQRFHPSPILPPPFPISQLIDSPTHRFPNLPIPQFPNLPIPHPQLTKHHAHVTILTVNRVTLKTFIKRGRGTGPVKPRQPGWVNRWCQVRQHPEDAGR